MIKACLFDLDGVIVDTAKYHYLAWKRLCNSLGFDLTEAENEHLKGISRAKSLDILLEKDGVTLSDAEKVHWMKVKNDWYLELVEEMTAEEILPGVRPFFESIRGAGLLIALGSASKNSRLILEKINMMPYFDAIIDGTLVTLGKPHPETFLLGAKALGVLPSECIVFEDSLAGVEAARAGNMRSVGVGDPAILTDADFVISTFEGQDLSLINRFN